MSATWTIASFKERYPGADYFVELVAWKYSFTRRASFELTERCMDDVPMANALAARLTEDEAMLLLERERFWTSPSYEMIKSHGPAGIYGDNFVCQCAIGVYRHLFYNQPPVGAAKVG